MKPIDHVTDLTQCYGSSRSVKLAGLDQAEKDRVISETRQQLLDEVGGKLLETIGENEVVTLHWDFSTDYDIGQRSHVCALMVFVSPTENKP